MKAVRCFFLLCFLVALSGCFKVGRLPATTQGGPGYDDPKSAILVPRGSQTQILMVNNQPVRSDALDKLANLVLQPLLMYLEPQVYLNQGTNVVLVRAEEVTKTDFGSFTRTTTTWRDYTVQVEAKVGERYEAIADLDRGATIVHATKEQGTKVARR